MERPSLKKYAWLSIGAAIATILLKTTAFLLTGSVGLLSDAAESLVNLVGAIVALIMLTIAARPADESHAHGHSKAEYFSSGIEGGLILIAAVTIAYAAIQRLFNPQPLEDVGIGVIVAVAASAINFFVSRVLLKAGKKYDSITLEADGKHLMTDVWTSIGVIGGVVAVAITGWERLDPIIALLVAVNIVWTAIGLLRRSVQGLMDASLPIEEQAAVVSVLENYKPLGVEYHALRTRQAAARRFISFHILVPGSWTVQHGHEVLEQIEDEICRMLPGAIVTAHLEPLEDPVSFADQGLNHAHD
ncbi:Ferrous-iron efflux pump FieF [Thermoflexales bacterium]|nr:Ferrous-iron efflux pump FieF [Thermoflexales bacterium]